MHDNGHTSTPPPEVQRRSTDAASLPLAIEGEPELRGYPSTAAGKTHSRARREQPGHSEDGPAAQPRRANGIKERKG